MSKTLETATLAGGCFWCTEAIFRRLKGVSSVLPGYIGGTVENPNYEQVCTGDTGHAEAIQLEFDPEILPYEKVLDVFWHTHDPTTLNQQGHDYGTQYRSAVFYHSPEQQKTAQELKAKLDASGEFGNPIVTEIVPASTFYVAEDYHKEYFERNQNAPYCSIVINPKLEKLMSQYGSAVA